MNDRITKFIIAIISSVIISILLIIFAFIYVFNWKTTTIAEFKNEQNGYAVIFQEVGETFLFGSSTVHIILEDEKGEKIDQIEDDINNDGKKLKSENISVDWGNMEVHVTLHGEEQQDELHIIKY